MGMILIQAKDQIGAQMLDSNNSMTDNGAEVKVEGVAKVFSGTSVAKLQLYDLQRSSIHRSSDYIV